MPSRIIREGINSSSRINGLSTGAEVFYRRLMSVVDDYGRFHGALMTLIGACWPINPDRVKMKEMNKWLNELLRGDRPLVRTYYVSGAVYIEIQDFDQQVRAKSRFPDPPWANTEQKNESCVYFVHAESSGKIKIGFTELPPKQRLSTLQIGSPEKLHLLGTFPGSMSDERSTHKLFSESQLDGEWFTETPELRAFIAEKCQQNASMPPAKNKASRIRSRISESESSYAADDGVLPFPAPPTEEELIAETAKRLCARHPKKRTCGEAEARKKLTAIVSKLPKGERAAKLAEIDRRHQGWCESDEWTKNNGEYAKGLANWLAPTEGRFDVEPPSRASPQERKLNLYNHDYVLEAERREREEAEGKNV